MANFTDKEYVNTIHKDDFTKYLPVLQSLIDCKIASVALESNMYSINTCEIIMTLLLQTIIKVVDKIKDKPKVIEQITAILKATRVDEAVNMLGEQNILNKLVGIDVKVSKGGSYFKELMKGGFSKSNKQTNKTQKGGAGCSEPCSTSNDCVDPQCANCTNGTCTGNQLTQMPSNRNNTVGIPGASPGIIGVGQPLSMHPNFAYEMHIANVANVAYAQNMYTNQSITNLTEKTMDRQKEVLDKAEEKLENANKKQEAAQKRLDELLLDKKNELDTRFETLLNKNEKELNKLVTREYIAAGTGTVLGGTATYQFTTSVLQGLSAMSAGIGSFVYWFLISLSRLPRKFPFAHHVVTLYENECYDENYKNPLGKIYPVLVTNQTQVLYSYVEYDPVYGNTTYSNQTTCPEYKYDSTSIFTYFKRGRVGNCTQLNSTVYNTGCDYFPDLLEIDKLISGTNMALLVIIASILSGFVVLYITKVVTLQTQLTRKLTFLSAIPRGIQYATGLGAIVDILMPSKERSDLIYMVTNNLVKNSYPPTPDTLKSYVKFLTPDAFIALETKLYKEQGVEYKNAIDSLKNATETYNKETIAIQELRKEYLRLTRETHEVGVNSLTHGYQQIDNGYPQIDNGYPQIEEGNSNSKSKSKSKKHNKNRGGTRKYKKYSHKRR